MNEIIATNSVNLYYDDYHALKSISMEIKLNTVTALIGPSGCGKSTYLRLFNRMNDLIDGVKISGSIIVDGKDVYEKGTDIVALRRKVGMVFQKPNPFPKSVFENVAYGLRVNGIEDKKKIEEQVEKSLKQAALW
jgi:phosphate transport system ATP-binding protein